MFIPLRFTRHHDNTHATSAIPFHSTYVMKKSILYYNRHLPILLCLDGDRVPEFTSSINSLSTQLLLNPQQLIILGNPFTTRRRARLELARAQTNSDISDGHVLGLAGAMGDHDAPAGGVGVAGGIDGLG